MAAGERTNEPGGISMSLHRERCQLQSGNPAFRAGFQRGNVFDGEPRPITWLRNSAASEGEKRRSAARSSVNCPWHESGPAAVRVFSRGDDQVHLRRQMLDRKFTAWSTRFDSTEW